MDMRPEWGNGSAKPLPAAPVPLNTPSRKKKGGPEGGRPFGLGEVSLKQQAAQPHCAPKF
jgi:hypothetical protein